MMMSAHTEPSGRRQTTEVVGGVRVYGGAFAVRMAPRAMLLTVTFVATCKFEGDLILPCLPPPAGAPCLIPGLLRKSA